MTESLVKNTEKVFLRDDVARKIFTTLPSSLNFGALIIREVSNFKGQVNQEADALYSLNDDWIDIEINYNKYKDGQKNYQLHYFVFMEILISYLLKMQKYMILMAIVF